MERLQELHNEEQGGAITIKLWGTSHVDKTCEHNNKKKTMSKEELHQ
jgi:hypothetical protein